MLWVVLLPLWRPRNPRSDELFATIVRADLASLCAGAPVLFGWQLYRHREVLHLPGPRHQLGFLYTEYSERLWWYEIIEQIRKLLLW